MKKKFVLLIIFVCLLSGCQNTNISNQYNDVYELSEFLDEEQYNKYMNDDGSLFNKLLDFKKQLTVSKNFEFFPYGNNFVEVIDIKIPETCITNYGTDYADESKYMVNNNNVIASEAIQVTNNFFSLFPVELEEGRFFIDDDFNYRNDDTIPVILGKTYKDIFKLNDTFEAYYICERKTFVVIGFIKQGYEFYCPSISNMKTYDNYIVMPFENINNDSYSSRAILLQEICGFVKGNNVPKQIKELLRNAGLDDWQEMVKINNKSLSEKLEK